MELLHLKLLMCLLTLIPSGHSEGSGDDEMSMVDLLQPSMTSERISSTSENSVFVLTSIPSLPSSAMFLSSPHSTPLRSAEPTATVPRESSALVSSLESSASASSFSTTMGFSLSLSSLFVAPSLPPSSSSVLPSSPSYYLPMTSSLTTTDSNTPGAGSSFQSGIISGAAGGVVAAILILVILFIIVVACVVAKKRRKSGKLTISTQNDFIMVTPPEDDKHCTSPTSTDEKLHEFGYGTNSFGITNFPDIAAPSGGEDLPALVFINPVDPSIPVSSNTLPLRGKLKVNKKSEGDLKSHFNPLTRESTRGHRSMGSLDKVGIGSAEPLTADVTLHELTRDRMHTNGSGGNNAETNRHEEEIFRRTQVSAVNVRPSDGYGYFFKESNDDLKISTFMQSKESSVVYDVPNKVVAVAKTESSSELNPSAPDKSHYDVPRKVLEEARARAKAKEAERDDEKDGNIEKYDEESIKESTNILDHTDGVLPDNIEEQKENRTTPSGLTSVDIAPANNPVKKEGIYDVPRSIMAESPSVSISDQAQMKSGKPPVRTKPKIAPRAPTTKLSSNSIRKIPKISTETCSTASDPAENAKDTENEAVIGEMKYSGGDESSEPSLGKSMKDVGHNEESNKDKKPKDVREESVATKSMKIARYDVVDNEGSTDGNPSVSKDNDATKHMVSSPEKDSVNAGSAKEEVKETRRLDSPEETSKLPMKLSKVETDVEKPKLPSKPKVTPRTKDGLQSPKTGRLVKPPVGKNKPAPPPRQTSSQNTPPHS